jgi:FAD/FMN-containing dehydrogenase
VGGQIPFENGQELLLSLDRMTKILNVDAADSTMTVQAGVTLKSVQDAAAEAGRLFPLSLASEGSCRIGGNLSTNAGGLNVLDYGSARDLCLGLEVVLPDGRIWNGLRRLRKDNTGYDLKNLFIGAEGTLGVITAVLAFPAAEPEILIAVTSPRAVDLLSLARDMSGNRVVAFELIPRIAMDFTVKHMGITNPLAEFSPWYALSELADPVAGSFERILEEAMTRGLVTDATVAQSETTAGTMGHSGTDADPSSSSGRSSMMSRCPYPYRSSLRSYACRKCLHGGAVSHLGTWAMATCISMFRNHPAWTRKCLDTGTR